MPPILWPPEPSFITDSERRVWNRLRGQLGENDLLIANQRFTTRRRDFELDLAVVLDGAGVVVIEVKGGRIWAEEGAWWRTAKDGDRRLDPNPVEQAMTVKHVLRDWVTESAAWGGRTAIPWVHAVCFPDIEVDHQFAMPDCSRWMVIDRHDLADVAGKLRTLVQVQEKVARPADASDVVAIHEVLSGRFLPQRDAVASVGDQVADHDEVLERLTEEQGTILDALQLLKRVEVRGGAGSGKTWLAVEQARRLAKQGQRVALICYSRGLAAWMKRRVDTFSHREKPAYVGTFHELGVPWGADVDADNDDPQFWEKELPEQMLRFVKGQPTAQLFDAIVIDESQDFADLWWPVVLSALKYEDDALYVFSDEGQRIFSRFGNTPSGLVPIVLDRNLRNTRQISQTFTSMAPNRMRASTYDGPDVQFIQSAHDQALDAADDAVERLLEDGWEPSDIALLTTGPRHPEQQNRQGEGWQSYWDSFWDKDQVFYGHVSGFKGLERPAIVLALNEQPQRDRAKERLYVGLSRARDLLVVCGEAEHIKRVGGPAVLRKIGGEPRPLDS